MLFEDVVDRLAVQHRPGAARVVGHHAADRGPAGGRDVGGEAESMRLEGGVQFIEHDAGLDNRPPGLDVEFKDAVHVLRRIDLEADANRLASLRGAAAAHRERTPVGVADLDGPDDVLACSGHEDAERLNVIHARVCGVERARHGIESNFARGGRLEFAAQRSDVHGSSGSLRNGTAGFDEHDGHEWGLIIGAGGAVSGVAANLQVHQKRPT